MRRVFLIVVVLGVLLIGGGIAYLGAFPPPPHQQPVQKVLPNDGFKTN